MEEVISLAAKSIAEAIQATGQPSGWITAGVIVNILLAIITGIYAWRVYKQLNEMKQQRQSTYRPVVVMHLVWHNSRNFTICPKNVGNEMAHNVKMEFDPPGIVNFRLGAEMSPTMELTAICPGVSETIHTSLTPQFKDAEHLICFP